MRPGHGNVGWDAVFVHSFENLFIMDYFSIHFDFSNYYLKLFLLISLFFFGHLFNVAPIRVPAVPLI